MLLKLETGGVNDKRVYLVMPFGMEERRRIRKESGYRCMICNSWHPPTKNGPSQLDAHSLDRTHTDSGMAVCRNTTKDNCHGRIHSISSDAEVVKQVSEEAARLAGASLADELLRQGVPERRIRRILTRRPY